MTDDELQDMADVYGLYTQQDVQNKDDLIAKLQSENDKLKTIIQCTDEIERCNSNMLEQYELKLKQTSELIKRMKPYARELCKNHKVISLNHTNECYWCNNCNECDKWEVKE